MQGTDAGFLEMLILQSGTGIVRWLALFMFLLTLAGCSSEPPSPLRVGTNVWPGYEPLYLAETLGYYQDTGVKLVEYPNATEVIRAYRNGVIEAAALTLDEVMLLAESPGMDPRVVLVMDISEGADVIIGRSDIGSMQALRGRRIGVENSALGAFMLARGLQDSGMTAADVTVVALPVNEQEQAFRANEVDAVVTFEPVRSRLLAAGGTQLFDSSQIPGEIVDVLVVRQDVLDRGRGQVRALLAGWKQALDYRTEHSTTAMNHLARHMSVELEEAAFAIEGLHIPDLEQNLRMLGGGSATLLAPAQRLLDTMRSQQLIASEVDVFRLFDSKPLEALR